MRRSEENGSATKRTVVSLPTTALTLRFLSMIPVVRAHEPQMRSVVQLHRRIFEKLAVWQTWLRSVIGVVTIGVRWDGIRLVWSRWIRNLGRSRIRSAGPWETPLPRSTGTGLPVPWGSWKRVPRSHPARTSRSRIARRVGRDVSSPWPAAPGLRSPRSSRRVHASQLKTAVRFSPPLIRNRVGTEREPPFSIGTNSITPLRDTMVIVGRLAKVDRAAKVAKTAAAERRIDRNNRLRRSCELMRPVSCLWIMRVEAARNDPIPGHRGGCHQSKHEEARGVFHASQNSLPFSRARKKPQPDFFPTGTCP